MDSTERRLPSGWVAFYSVVGLGWAVLAFGIVPPLLAAEYPGPAIVAVKEFLRIPPVLFLRQGPLDQWREFSTAVLIALVLHFTIVVILGRYDRQAAGGDLSRPARRVRWMNLALGFVTLAFLVVTIIAPIRQDYFFYLEIWYHVQHGQDPWFTVPGQNGIAPLNAYGPLFNPLAALSWINPLGPKLLFAYAYMIFAITQTKGFAAGHRPSALQAIGLLALFWNPFPWVEIAFHGHFDILIGLTCLWAVRALVRDREVLSGLYLASGVLLKYLPIVLLPFLAFDRGRQRPRLRFLIVVLVFVSVGLGVSFLIWGPSTYLPLRLATTRGSAGPSFIRYLRGRHGPFPWLLYGPSADTYAPLVQLIALGGAWWWSRETKLDVEASAVVAVLIMVVLYRVGYPQYQMVPIVLSSAWLLGQWDRLRNRIVPAFATALYFGCLAAIDVDYMLNEAWLMNVDWAWVQDMGGLPTFLLGSLLVASVLWTSPREGPDAGG